MVLTVASSNGTVAIQDHNSFVSLVAPSLADYKYYQPHDQLVVNTGSACIRYPRVTLGVKNGQTSTQRPIAPNELITGQSTTSNGNTTTTTYTYNVYSVLSISDYGDCGTSVPNNGLPMPVADTSNAGSTIMAVVAPTPSPLSLYNEMVNTHGNNYMRAYTYSGSTQSGFSGGMFNLAPSLVDVTYCVGSGVFRACSVTGCPADLQTLSNPAYCNNIQIPINYTEGVPAHGTVTAAIPASYYLPQLVQQNPPTWLLLTDRASRQFSASNAYDFLPLYAAKGGALTGNVACLKVDTDQAVYIDNPPDGFTEDVVFRNLKFINHSRMSFKSVLGANSTIKPDGANGPSYLQKLLNPSVAQSPFSATLTVSNQGVQLVDITIQGSDQATYCAQTSGGGAQIYGIDQSSTKNPNTGGGYGFGPVWGNFVYNYTAASTADDSLVFFSDIGGHTVNITTSSPAGSTTGTVTYPRTQIEADTAASGQISNSYVRFIFFNSSSDDISLAICSALTPTASVSSITNALGSQTCANLTSAGNTLTWPQPQALVSTILTSTGTTSTSTGTTPTAIGYCDPLVITGCPITYLTDSPTIQLPQPLPHDGTITTTLPVMPSEN